MAHAPKLISETERPVRPRTRYFITDKGISQSRRAIGTRRRPTNEHRKRGGSPRGKAPRIGIEYAAYEPHFCDWCCGRGGVRRPRGAIGERVVRGAQGAAAARDRP